MYITFYILIVLGLVLVWIFLYPTFETLGEIILDVWDELMDRIKNNRRN